MQSPYLIEHQHMAVKRCRHGLFMYNRNDSFIGRALDLYGEWCEFEIQLLRRFIRLGDTVIDAGANIGTHALAFANLVGPTGLVHAFEPQRRNFMILAGNVALNALGNVICHQEAIGETNARIKLPPLPPPDTHFNFGSVSIAQGSEAGEDAPLVTLDSLDLPDCRVIKIDTEGMEPQVLRGAQNLIERRRPILYLENYEQGGSKQLAPILDEIGYLAWWSIHPYYDSRNFYSTTENVWQNYHPSANMLCAPKEAEVDMADHEPFLGEDDNWRACLQRIASRAQR